MPDYSDHKKVLEMLAQDQEADKDNRDRAKEAHLFLDKRDGQWEPTWWERSSGKPRYTFDMTTPIVDQICGEMEKADFSITVRPAGGEASKKTANVLDGLIRNIENISGAVNIYNQSSRAMVVGGFDAWRVSQRYIDGDSFDQDLIIEPISNAIDRVWFDCSSELQDRSDARWAFVLQGFSKDEYEERWPKGSGESIKTPSETSAYVYKPDLIMVGEFYYIKQVERELAMMSNGSVLEMDDKYKSIADELAKEGITVKRTRKRKKNVVCVRQFDNGGWLSESKETVFKNIPIIPCYANFKIFENKTIYFGAVEKLIDPQRVMNYSMSREIEEGALAPRAKYWMTSRQVGSHKASLETMNTNSDPVQLYDPDERAPNPPPFQGGAQINPGLRTISESMRQIIGQSAGMFAANMGDNPGLQSGVAIKQLQNKGDLGTIKYFSAREVAIAHTARVIVDAIPEVFDNERQVRILNQDGSFDMVTLNQTVFDEQTQQNVVINDLSKGRYDVICSAGPAFQNRQDQMISAIIEMAQVDPTIIQLGGDVMLNAVAAPGMDKIAERKRLQLLQSGVIPQTQMTDEEKQAVAQAQSQPQQPDAQTLLAQAEMEKAKAAQMKVETEAMLRQTDQEIAMAKVEIAAQKEGIGNQQKQQEFALQLEKMRQDMLLALQEQERKNNEAITSMQKQQAETLVLLQKASQSPSEMPDDDEEKIDEAIDQKVIEGVSQI